LCCSFCCLCGRPGSTDCDTLRSCGELRTGRRLCCAGVSPMIRKEWMNRFLYALCALSFALPWSSGAFAEPLKIGFMSPAAPSALAAMSDVLSGQLAAHGLVRGRDFTFELRAAEGKPERLPALAKGLVDAHVAAILALSYPAARAAADAT